MADSSTTTTNPPTAQAATSTSKASTPPVDAKPKWPGEQARTNMGWDTHVPAGTDWPYTIISEELFDAEYARVAQLVTALDGRADGAMFQPADPAKSQDRLSVQEWALKDGSWTFAAVFDGHGGDATVNYVVEALPAELKGRLASLVAFTSPVQANAVGTTIQDAITHIDDGLQRDLLALFPGGVDSLAKMTDDEVKVIINDKERGAMNIIKVLRAQHGSTALIALQDPSRENLWIAGLGDCSAILVSKNPDGWAGKLLTEVHNGLDQGEVERVRAEHPGEEGAIMGYRVLNTIMVTRAIGDHAFKLPRDVVERVLLNADPPMVTRAEKIENWVPRILTPPYLTNKATVQHVKLDRDADRFLILASDGLTDLLTPDSPMLTPELIHGAAQAVGEAKENGTPRSTQLLKYAMGGSDMAKASRYLTVDFGGKAWMDDTTVVCLQL